MKRIEVVSLAIFDSPPLVRGFLVGDRVRKLLRWEGHGRARTFWFDQMKPIKAGKLVRMYRSVAVKKSLEVPALTIHRTEEGYVRCPACGASVRAHTEFWQHYNRMHAIRPNWLNEKDWQKILEAPYRQPPEWDG